MKITLALASAVAFLAVLCVAADPTPAEVNDAKEDYHRGGGNDGGGHYGGGYGGGGYGGYHGGHH